MTRIRRLAALSAILVTFSVTGCSKPGVLDLKPSWKAGDKAAFDVVKAKHRMQGAIPIPLFESRDRVEIEVISVDYRGYLIRWRKDAAKPEDESNSMVSSSVPPSSELLNGLDCLIELEPSGRFRLVRNWEDVRQRVVEFVGAIRRKTINPKMRDELEFLLEPFESALADRTQLERIVIVEASPWFELLGRTYSHSNPVTVESEDVTALGPPLPAIDTFTLKSAVDKPGNAVIKLRRALNSLLATEVLEQRVHKYFEKKGKTVPSDWRGTPPKLEMISTTEIDPQTGWLSKLSRKSTDTIGSKTLEETLEINRLLP